MRKIYSVLFLFLAFLAFAQIKFQPGYIILNNGIKKDVLIKNNDWKYSPTTIEIKYSEENKPETLSIKELSGFEINNESKYVRAIVDIDQSSFDLKDLSEYKNPKYKKAEVFLKLIVAGKVNLYEYQQTNSNFFIQKEGEEFVPLVYKMYYLEDSNKFTYNNGYKFQLSRYLNCDEIKKSSFDNVAYTRKDLGNLVIAYNKCENSDLVYEEVSKIKKIDVNLGIRPRYNFSTFSFDKYSLENKSTFGIGLEGEFVLPFNKNKWAILIEPTYQYYKSDGTKNEVKIDYKSIELPFGIRYYFFLNDKNKLFANVQYQIDFDLGSRISFYTDGVKGNRELDIKSSNTFALGFGYNYNSKLSVEARYIPTRNLLSNYNYWNSNYQIFSFIIGYNIF